MTELESQTIVIEIRNISNLVIQWKQYFQKLLRMSESNDTIEKYYYDLEQLYNSNAMQLYLQSFNTIFIYNNTRNIQKATIRYTKNDRDLSNGLFENITQITEYHNNIDLYIVGNIQKLTNQSNKQSLLASRIIDLHQEISNKLDDLSDISYAIYYLVNEVNNQSLQITSLKFNTNIFQFYLSVIITLMQKEDYIYNGANAFYKCGVCSEKAEDEHKTVQIPSFSVSDITINNADSVTNVSSKIIYKSCKIWTTFKHDIGPCKKVITLNVNQTGNYPLYIKHNDIVEVASELYVVKAGTYPCYFQNTRWIVQVDYTTI